jgi:hypothetical protein
VPTRTGSACGVREASSPTRYGSRHGSPARDGRDRLPDSSTESTHHERVGESARGAGQKRILDP